MRKLLGIFGLLFIAMGCKKTDTKAPFYTATFMRTIDAGTPWTWAFSNSTDGHLSFTQTFNTGSAAKQTRWTLNMQDPPDHTSFTLSFPGIDSSANLLTGKDMTFSWRITQSTPSNLTCSLIDKGSYYTGGDSAFVTINFDTYDKKTVTGTFSCQLYNQGTNVLISNGHLTGIPVTLAN